MATQNEPEQLNRSERVQRRHKPTRHHKKKKRFFTFLLVILLLILGFILFSLNRVYQSARDASNAIYSPPSKITKARNPPKLFLKKVVRFQSCCLGQIPVHWDATLKDGQIL